MSKTHVLSRALIHRERDQLFAAFSANLLGDHSILFHISTVDAGWTPIPGTGLDLVVRAGTTDDAYAAWERHAEDAGAVGEYRVLLTYVSPATENEPAAEKELLRKIDLDMIALCDELGDLYDEDVRLGLAVPHAF